MGKEEYIIAISELLEKCTDFATIDLIHKLLVKTV